MRRSSCLGLVVVLLLVLSAQIASADEAPAPQDPRAVTRAQFGGPNSVPGQLEDDARPKRTLVRSTMLEGYFNWKDCLKKRYGLSYTLDYTAGVLGATRTLGTEDSGASGAVRFFGAWDLVGRRSGNTGTFIWKIENRHKYTDIPASGVAGEVGYVGAVLPVLSDIGTRLTNLYWKQNLCKGRVEIIAGFLDTTDWVDLYALASPWNGFTNFAFATGSAAMPVPDDAAIGLYVNAMLTRNLYVIGGLADSNADSTDPFSGVDTFFGDQEYFKTIELGWTTCQQRFFLDNTHLTLWHVDERTKAGVASGWGMNFSFAHAFNDKWMPFLRAGYADDGGSLLQKSVSVGLGYHLPDGLSLLGLGFNWGEPNEGTLGPGLRDQYAAEIFGRLQVLRNLEVTPLIHWIKNPARNPGVSDSWVFGLRARMFF